MDMYNYLQKISVQSSHHFLRKLAVTLILLIGISGNIWGATYFWVGTTGNWNDSANWSTTMNGTGGAGIPGSSDIAIIYSDATATAPEISLSSDITIATAFLFGETNTTSINLNSHILTCTGSFFVGSSYNQGIVDAYNNILANIAISNGTLLIETFDSSSWGLNSGFDSSIFDISSVTMIINSWIGCSDASGGITISGDGNITITGNIENIDGISPTPGTTSGSLSISPANTPVSFTWTGNSDTDWATPANWSGNIVPIANSDVTIPYVTNAPVISSSTTAVFKSLILESNASLTFDQDLELTNTFISKLTAPASGTAEININGKLTVSSEFNNEHIIINAVELQTDAGFKCHSFNITGESIINSTTDFVVATDSSGMTFGDTVTVNAPTGNGIPFAGNVNASTSIVFDVTQGILNHVAENGNKTWSPNATVVLNDGATLSMAGSGTSYSVTIAAASGDVYIAGSGTISSLIDNSGSTTNIHLGNSAATGGVYNEDQIALSTDLNLNSTGNLILDNTCESLTGNQQITLNGNLRIISSKITNQLTFDFIFNNDVTFPAVTGDKNINLQSAEFKGDVTINSNNTFGTFTANTPGKTVTINDEQTVTTLELSGDSTNRLTIAGNGSFIIPPQENGDYLSIGENVKIISSSGSSPDGVNGAYYKATNSIPAAGTNDSDYITVVKNGWKIYDLSKFTYTWIGAIDTDWNNSDNWDIGIAPVNDATIIIAECTSNIYPELNGSSAIQGGNLTINSSAEIYLNNASLELSGNAGTVAAAATLTNNGKIIYQSTGRITDGTNVINDSANGTVEYNGNGTITTSINYNNLLISSANWGTSGTLIANTIEINSTSDIGTTSSPILVKTNDLSAYTTSGDICISNIHTTSITFGNIKTDNGNISLKADNFTISTGKTINSGAGTTTISTYDNTKNLTIPELDYFTGTGTLFLGSSDHTGNIILGNSNNISLPANTEITGSETVNSSSLNTNGKSLTINGNLTNNQAVIGTSADIKITGNYTGTGTFKASSNNTIFNGNVDFSNNFDANNGTVIFEDDIKDSTIKGNIEFYNFTCVTPGKTLLFQSGETFVINGKLNIAGSKDTITNNVTFVNLTSTSNGTQWEIKCTSGTAALHSVVYANIQDSKNISTYRLNATGPSSDSGNNINWNFIGLVYVWKTNAATNDWFTNTNWNPSSVPGIGANVEIPAATNHPIVYNEIILSDSTTGTSDGKITLTDSASILDLQGENVTANKIINHGKIRLFGTQTITADVSNSTATGGSIPSTVEYYGTQTVCNTLPFVTTYQNIIFSGSTQRIIASTSSLSISGKAKFDTTGIISFTSADDLIIENPGTAAELSIDASGKIISLKGDFTGKQTYKANKVTANGTGIISGPTGATLEIIGNFETDTSSETTLAIPAIITGSFTNKGQFKGNGTVSITENLTDSGIWTNTASITFNGTANQTFTVNPEITYPSVNIDKTSGNTAFSGNTNITSFSDTPTSGNITFQNNISITNNIIFTTTGIVKIGNSAANVANFATVNHTEGETHISGQVNSTQATFADVSLFTDSTINASTGNISIESDISGSNYTLTLNSPHTISLTNTQVKELIFEGNTSSTEIEFANTINTTQNLIIPFAAKLNANTIFTADTIFTSNNNLQLQSNTLTCNNNLEIQNGLHITAGNLEINKDFVLFGPDYNDTDQVSQNTNIYVYNETIPTFAKISGSKFQTDTGLTIKVLKNFYANGIKAESSGEWTLQLKSNKNTSVYFAEAFYCDFSNSKCKIVCLDSSSPDAVLIAAEECDVASGYENGWDIQDFKITNVYTVDDDTICIEFNRPVRNLSNILNTKAGRILHSSGNYTGFYSDVNCTSALPQDNSIYSTVYLKSDRTWNTDATGTDVGASLSTDKENNHKNVKPYLDIKRNSISGTDIYKSFITDLYGKRLWHYSNSGNGAIYDSVTDKCNPVLTTVKTGQEMHNLYDTTVGETSQHSYDSHNFLEFTYSEPVNFGTNEPGKLWIPTTLFDENIQVTDDFGAISTSINAEAQFGFTLQGLGTIEKGRIYTGSNGTPDKYVNALYRNSTHAIRLSIAGFTSGTVTDEDGNIYKNWVGYIENAVTPSGAVTISDSGNPLVSDLSGNIQMPVPDNIHISVNSTTNGIYSKWDTSEPIFAPLRLKPSDLWSECSKDQMSKAEAVGNTNGSGSTLDRIEFHFFDNEPTFTSDEAEWLTEKGWIIPGSGSLVSNVDLYDSSYTYCADIIGGARQFSTSASNRTTGGIRYSSIHNISSAFRYSTNENSTNPDKLFVAGSNAVHIGAKAPLFTGASTPRRSAEILDGLYFALELTDSNLPVTQSFAVSYDENSGYVTDLAGNRLRSATIKTIDRTPPSFDFTLGAINKNELYIAFVKYLVTATGDLAYIDSTGTTIPFNEIDQYFENLIPKCFDLITISSSGSPISCTTNQIDYTKPAVIEHVKSQENGQDFTIIRLKLENNITLSEIQTVYLRLKCPSEYSDVSQDPITGLNGAHVTFIQDYAGNYMQMYEAHSLSDFAINVVNPLYAYDSEMTFDDDNIFEHIYSSDSFAVHDWSASQQNYGTLPANHTIEIFADLDDGTEEKNNLPAGVKIFLSSNPLASSVSTQINEDFNKKLRIWLPDIDVNMFKFLADNNNPLSNCNILSSTPSDPDDSSKIEFTIPQEITKNWGSNKQISFVFALTDATDNLIKIYNVPYYDATNGTYNFSLSTPVPLYALRLENPDEISSIDLWSFKLKSTTEQRGGVTILNNVINPTLGEKTVLKVNVPEDGKLNITVMTLDGNIITHLNHGETTAGEHYFYWDGKNRKNQIAARGMYFIRITGNGFDETRKVMIVK